MTLPGLGESKPNSNKISVDVKKLASADKEITQKTEQVIADNILDTLTNLSNDEVLTPPNLAREMLNELPESLWKDPETTVLDPGSKSGVFLAEAFRKLYKGLEETIPDSRERINHILKKQLFGIATTELTAHMSRRTLYCSMYPNGDYSLVKFDTPTGNILYLNLKEDRGAEGGYSLDASSTVEHHNYPFSAYEAKYVDGKYKNNESLEKLLNEGFGRMKFNVIIGNPPYQLNDSSGTASASPLYHRFVENAIALDPDYICMITPTRWTVGGKGLDSFRERMLKDRHIAKFVDYPDSRECFPENSIEGGVSYFLWDKNHSYDTKKTKVTTKYNGEEISSVRDLSSHDVFIRSHMGLNILESVSNKESIKTSNFSSNVLSRNPFGLSTNYVGYSAGKMNDSDLLLYANKKTGWVKTREITKNKDIIYRHKALLSKAYGGANSQKQNHNITSKPFYAGPNEVCTETYLVCGVFDSKEEAENCVAYMKTKFFRFMLSLRKQTQDISKEKFSFIPNMPMNKVWTDAMLYKHFNLSEEQVSHIEKTVREMS